MLKNRLKVLLAEKEMKHWEFADAMGVTRNTASNWVTGKSNPSLEQCFDIADFFGVKVTDIWMKVEKIPEP